MSVTAKLSRYALKRKLRSLQDAAVVEHRVSRDDLDRLFETWLDRAARQNGGARPRTRTEEIAAYVGWLQEWVDGHERRQREIAR